MRLSTIAVTLALAILAGLGVHRELLWRWDQGVYDALTPTLLRPPPSDLVIVAVDQASLSELGQWPWPRSLHASLIRKLTQDDVAAIVMDILFAESDRQNPEADTDLAQALEEAGNVILPITIGENQEDGILTETLPIPEIASKARQLAHADIPLDEDGIARRVHLHLGLGDPRWPHIALAALEMIGYPIPGHAVTDVGASLLNTSPLVSVSKDEIRIPFTGPPGHFHQVSYADVIANRFPPGAFRDKVVLVGATATGLGDFVPTPVSGGGQLMAGVEVTANLIDGLRREAAIVPLEPPWTNAITIVFVVLPALLMVPVRPQTALAVAAGFVLLPLLSSLLLLHQAHFWFPPATSILMVLATFILWSTRRLVIMLHGLNYEIDQLRNQPVIFPEQRSSFTEATQFIGRYLPLRGLLVTDRRGRVEEEWGERPARIETPPSRTAWARNGQSYWTTVGFGHVTRHIGYLWNDSSTAAPKDLERLRDIAEKFYGRQPAPASSRPTEFLQSRINQLRTASSRIQVANQFIANSMAQATSGILVVDSSGINRLANRKAALLLCADRDTPLLNHPVDNILRRIEFPGSRPLEKIFETVVRGGQPVTVEAEGPNGRQLLVSIGEFADATQFRLNGLILHLMDITQFKAAERQRRDMLSFISHDFRSPLASILAIMELARQAPEQFDGSMAERVEQMSRNALELADNLLHLMRHAQDGPLRVLRTNLAPIARFGMFQVMPQASAKHIEMTIDIPAEDCWIMGNEHMLERVFANLLTDAVKYSPEHASIHIAIWRSDARVFASVADTGHGIPADELPHLFERYQSFRRDKQSGGTGLGLAFVSSVVAQHNGHISVTSQPGEGTTFKLSFAFAADDKQHPE